MDNDFKLNIYFSETREENENLENILAEFLARKLEDKKKVIQGGICD